MFSVIAGALIWLVVISSCALAYRIHVEHMKKHERQFMERRQDCVRSGRLEGECNLIVK